LTPSSLVSSSAAPITRALEHPWERVALRCQRPESQRPSVPVAAGIPFGKCLRWLSYLKCPKGFPCSFCSRRCRDQHLDRWESSHIPIASNGAAGRYVYGKIGRAATNSLVVDGMDIATWTGRPCLPDSRRSSMRAGSFPVNHHLFFILHSKSHLKHGYSALRSSPSDNTKLIGLPSSAIITDGLWSFGRC